MSYLDHKNNNTHSIYDSNPSNDINSNHSKSLAYTSSIGEVGFKQILGNKNHPQHKATSLKNAIHSISPEKSHDETFKKPIYKRVDSFDIMADLHSPLSPSHPSHAAIAMKAAIAGVTEIKGQQDHLHHKSHHNLHVVSSSSNNIIPSMNLLSPHLRPMDDINSNEPAAEKYFGMNARVDFFERYHWLSHQQEITNSSNEKKIDELLFDNEVYDDDRQSHMNSFHEKRSISSKPRQQVSDHHPTLPSTTSKSPSLSSPGKKNLRPNNATLQRTNSLVLPTLYGERRRSTDSIVNSDAVEKQCHDPHMSTSSSSSSEQQHHKSFPMTPRSKYLAACLSENVNPRASLIIRKELTKEIHLQHQGIGDQMAKLLSESIEGLPYLESINIADNRLTDVGMEPMLKMIALVPKLSELDLSQNIIGPKAAEALSLYLRNPTCPLERLVLQHADVDDSECKKFVDTLKHNNSVIEIDLSSNKIGESQGQHASHKDGGKYGVDAIADLLTMPNCRLKSLKLSWNKVRLSGAVHLADSLALNKSLILLDLSYNSLGKDGGIALGVAIQHNTCLETLLVSNNNIDGEACFTLAAGILENKSIKRLAIDGNPIGELGARALMMVPLLIGNRVKISVSKCNIHIKEQHHKFSFSNLACDYTLSMSDAVERAIAIMLTYLLAIHPTFEFKSFIHVDQSSNTSSSNASNGSKAGLNSSTGGKKRSSIQGENIKLVQTNIANNVDEYDENQIKAIESLKKLQLASNNATLMRELFQEVDEDGSGLIDPQELRVLMQLVGVDDIDDKRLSDIIDTYDTSGDNQLDMNGFTMLIKGQYAETTASLHQLTTHNVIAISGSNERYTIPMTGKIRCSVVDSFCMKQSCRTMTTCDKNYLFDVASTCGDEKADMITYGIDSAIKFRLDEGLAVFNGMKVSNIESNAKILRRILPSATNAIAAIHIIKHITGSNRSEIIRLKHEMGYSLKPIIGAPNGYYVLDMSKELDRLCLSRLITISTTHADTRSRQHPEYASYVHLGDISQHGNFSCFRNEIFNNQLVTIDASFATPMPTTGKLEFDFCTVDMSTDASLIVPMTDKKFVKMLVKSYLLPISQAKVVLKKLKYHQKTSNSLISCNGKVVYRANKERAEQIGETMSIFYKELNQRSKMMEENIPTATSKPTTAIGGDRDQHQTTASAVIAGARNIIESQIQVPLQAGKILRNSSQQGKRDAGKLPILIRQDTSHVVSIDEDPEMMKEVEGDNNDDTEKIGNDTLSNEMVDNDDDSDDDELVDQLRSALIEQDNHDGNNIASEVEGSNLPFVDQLASDKSFIVKKPKKASFLAVHDDFIETFKVMMESHTISTNIKTKKYLEVCEEMFGWSWLYARQVAALLEAYYPLGAHKRTKYFGTYRIDLVVILYDRIVDRHNFELILRVLSPYEIGCCYARIGWLNIFNPMKPDGAHQLDLSRYEERVVMKILSGLMVTEPGENWVEKCFRWQRDSDLVPGWEMVTTWMTDDGLPRRGILDVTYNSGDGEKKTNHNPQVDFRKSLLALVRIEEKDIIEEGKDKDMMKIPLPGEIHRKNYPTLWNTFFCGAPAKNTKKKEL